MAREQLSGIQIPTLSKLNIDGEITLDAQSGTTGQVLISQGSGNTPSWTSSLTSMTSVSSAVGTNLSITTAAATGASTGWLNLTTGGATTSGSSGNIYIDVGSVNSGQTRGSIYIGTTPFAVGNGNSGNIYIGNTSTPTTTRIYGTAVTDVINATSTSTTSADIFGNVTTGTVGVADGLTTGILNIATAATTTTGRTVNINTNASGSIGVTTNIGSPIIGSTINLATGLNGVVLTSTGLITTPQVTGSNSSIITIKTGATVTSGTSGNLILDTGVGATAGGDVKIGDIGASNVTIGRTSGKINLYTAPLNISQTSVTANTTVTAAIVLTTNLYLSGSTTAKTFTMDTGTNFDTALGSPAIGTTIEWFVINEGTSTSTITMAGGTNHTFRGTTTIAIATAARFITRKSAANTYFTYRV